MIRLVLDASVALAWLIDQPIPAYATKVRREFLNGARAIVPALWHLEVGNGLAIAERRRLLTADDADGALTVLNELASHLFETDVDLVPVSSAFSAARMHLLSAYDAVYLELAKRCQLPLATLDQPLRAAASKAGVELFR